MTVPMRSAEDWMNDWRIEMSSMNPKSKDLVQELIPDEGTTFSIIAGRSGIGKTVLALNMAYCLATGTDFFGFKTQKTAVGYLGFEGTKGKMFDRLDKISKNYLRVSDNFRFEITKPFYLFKDKQSEQDFLNLVSGCKIVFVDPIKYLIYGDYIRPSVVNDFIIKYMDLQQRGNFSTVFCMQVRKPNPNSIMEPGDLWDIKGAGDYVESATSVLLLERERQTTRPGGGFAKTSPEDVVLYFAKHRDAIGDMPPIGLRLDKTRLMFEVR